MTCVAPMYQFGCGTLCISRGADMLSDAANALAPGFGYCATRFNLAEESISNAKTGPTL